MAKKATKRSRSADPPPAPRKNRRQRQTKKKPAAKSQPSDLITGYRAIGERYEVSSRTIQDWVKNGLPTANDSIPRKFNPAETDPWVERFRADNPQPGKVEDEIDRRKRENRARREELLADELERKKQTELGQLLPLEDWELFATETITDARDRLLRIPKDFRRQLCKKCQAKVAELETLIIAALEALAKIKNGPDGKQ